MHHDDAASAIAVRMRILFAGAAVRGPTGVADAVGPIQRLEADHLFQIAQLALGAPDLQTIAVSGHGNARRIITAIFQPLQSVQDDGDDPLLTNVANNAAHGSPLACGKQGIQAK